MIFLLFKKGTENKIRNYRGKDNLWILKFISYQDKVIFVSNVLDRKC